MWISVALATDAKRAEALSEALLEHGAISVSIEDALAGSELEKPQYGEPGSLPDALWDQSNVVALFEPADDLIGRIHLAARDAGMDELPEIGLTEVAEQDWVRLTQSQFEPIHINDRLWIVPSWHMDKFIGQDPSMPPLQGEQITSPPLLGSRVEHGLQEANPESSRLLRLDPGLAFGTGSHPTTRLCLEWLTDTVAPGYSVLDYGCGSGILGITAALFGAGHVVGVDIDDKALEAAHTNADNNAVVLTLLHSREPLAERFDIVVANILTNPLKVLAPALGQKLKAGGRIALSGVLHEQAESVIEAYAPYVALHVGATLEGWCRLENEAPAC
jgi:ribosomal protein L11 methyltransferase